MLIVSLQHFSFFFQLFCIVLGRKWFLLVQSSSNLVCSITLLFLNKSGSKISSFPAWDTEVHYTGRANCPSLCMHEKQNKPKKLAAFLLHTFSSHSSPVSPSSFSSVICILSLAFVPWFLMCPWPSLLATSDNPCFSCTASSSRAPSQIEKYIPRSDL